jgi:hypothetical protein
VYLHRDGLCTKYRMAEVASSLRTRFVEKFKKVVSLGCCCHIAQTLRELKLVNCSYPFDWIRAEPTRIADILEDEFGAFMRRDLFKELPGSANSCSHEVYGEGFFPHKNPVKGEDYAYYERCIGRFKDVLASDDTKLFIMIYNLGEDGKDDSGIERVNKYLMGATKNYTLLLVRVHCNSERVNFTFKSVSKNVSVLNVYSKARSNGLQFETDIEDILFKKAITGLFQFDIEEGDARPNVRGAYFHAE